MCTVSITSQQIQKPAFQLCGAQRACGIIKQRARVKTSPKNHDFKASDRTEAVATAGHAPVSGAASTAVHVLAVAASAAALALVAAAA